MYIEKPTPKVGDWVYTEKEHSSCCGTILEHSYVMVVAIGSRGYDIEDECGNMICEIGWVI